MHVLRTVYTLLSPPDGKYSQIVLVKLEFYLSHIHFVFVHCFFSYFVCLYFFAYSFASNAAVWFRSSISIYNCVLSDADSEPCFYFSNTNIRWKMQINEEFWKKSTGFGSQIKGIRWQRCFLSSYCYSNRILCLYGQTNKNHTENESIWLNSVQFSASFNYPNTFSLKLSFLF